MSEESKIDYIGVAETGHVEVRRVTRILKDGEVVSRAYHRHILAPGDDLSNEDGRVVAIAAAAWKSNPKE